MAVKTKVQLTSDAQVIRDETVIDGNTATRVGEILIDMIDSLEEEGGGGGGGISNLVEDTTPQLGGDLDLNGNVITGLEIGTDVQAHSAVLDATTASFTTADETKLDNIEANADVTDSTNVDAAGATMNADTSLAGNGYFLDEDDMSSDDATKVPSQQSVKAYVDTSLVQVTGEDLTLSGAENLDLSTFDSFEGLLTGNTTITVSNTPASGVTFTRNLIISGSVGTETLTLPGTWNIYGEYVVDAINYLTIEFANFATNGLQVNCFINQPT